MASLARFNRFSLLHCTNGLFGLKDRQGGWFWFFSGRTASPVLFFKLWASFQGARLWTMGDSSGDGAPVVPEYGRQESCDAVNEGAPAAPRQDHGAPETKETGWGIGEVARLL